MKRYINAVAAVLLGTVLPACGLWANVPSGTALTLAQFRDCISSNGVTDGYSDGSSPYVCRLQNSATPYVISNNAGNGTLVVGRSGITIEGTVISSPADTTLQRGDSNTYFIMSVATGINNLVFQDMEFDGNRCGVFSGSTCPGTWPAGCKPPSGTSPATYIDLETEALDSGWGTSSVGIVSIDFINAPQQSLTVPSGSYVEYSNFTGAANSGVVTFGPPLSTVNIYDNQFYHDGGSAIALQNVNTAYVQYNSMVSTEYESPDGGAGQLDISQDDTNIWVFGNTINGEGGTNACVGGVGVPAGIELWGSYVYLSGNLIEGNGAAGVVGDANNVSFAPNAYNSSPNWIQNNGWDGVHFENYGSPFGDTNTITFSGQYITGNAGTGLVLNYAGRGPIHDITVDSGTITNMGTSNRGGRINSNCGPGGYNCPASQ